MNKATEPVQHSLFANARDDIDFVINRRSPTLENLGSISKEFFSWLWRLDSLEKS